MTPFAPKKFYTRFLAGHSALLHFAAHSHHFWPDVSREAQLAYWDDCALSSDEKWSKVFTEVIPKAQKHIASILNLQDPSQIAFAPNTHELTTRLLSVFLGKKELSILTTTNEFHSWRRQLLRLSELPEIKVTMLSPEDIEGIKRELKRGPDLFFISQVFFDSGAVISTDVFKELIDCAPKNTLIAIDGYHGFAAVPTDLSQLEGRIFYLGGGYKYAQAGEGMGFIVVPKGEWRPAYTGWFAEYAELTTPKGPQVGYSQDYMAFMGATQDPSGLYRFNAVWDLFQSEGLDVNKIHSYVLNLQKTFIQGLPEKFSKDWDLQALFDTPLGSHGHFLTFEASSEEKADRLQQALKIQGVVIDRRGSRLRFGFGLYQDQTDVQKLLETLLNLSCPQ
jgi:selenocysteine lyase/cysteine desulfurase